MKFTKRLKKLMMEDVLGFEVCDCRVSMKELKKPEDTEVRVLVEKGKNDRNKRIDS